MVIVVLSSGGWHDVAYGAKKNRTWTEQEVSDFGWVCEPKIGCARIDGISGIQSFRVQGSSVLEQALISARDCGGPAVVEFHSDPKATEYYLSFVAA